MSKSDVCFLASFVMVAPHVGRGTSLILGALLLVAALIVAWIEREDP